MREDVHEIVGQMVEGLRELQKLIVSLKKDRWTLDVLFSPHANPDVPPDLPAFVFDTITQNLIVIRKALRELVDLLLTQSLEDPLVVTFCMVVEMYEGILLDLLGLSGRIIGGMVDAIQAAETTGHIVSPQKVKNLKGKAAKTLVKKRVKGEKSKLPD